MAVVYACVYLCGKAEMLARVIRSNMIYNNRQASNYWVVVGINTMLQRDGEGMEIMAWVVYECIRVGVCECYQTIY